MRLKYKEDIESFKGREGELKKSIKEQLDYIILMEKDMKELRVKNNEYKTKNEIILSELELIKEEFSSLSGNFNYKKNSNLFIKILIIFLFNFLRKFVRYIYSNCE